MRERAENRTPKLLLIAGAENERGLKAWKNGNNPSSHVIAHQSAAHRDSLIEQHFLHGRTHTLIPRQVQTARTVIRRKFLRNPMEWE